MFSVFLRVYIGKESNHPLDIDAQIDFMTDFASTHHREYDSGRGQFLQKTHQGQIPRSKSDRVVFRQRRRILHILYTLKEEKTITMINYVCSANYMKIDRELKQIDYLVICLKMMIL